jgi:hypothetical protein
LFFSRNTSEACLEIATAKAFLSVAISFLAEANWSLSSFTCWLSDLPIFLVIPDFLRIMSARSECLLMIVLGWIPASAATAAILNLRSLATIFVRPFSMRRSADLILSLVFIGEFLKYFISFCDCLCGMKLYRFAQIIQLKNFKLLFFDSFPSGNERLIDDSIREIFMPRSDQKIVHLKPIDNTRSSVVEELDSLDYQLSLISRELSNIEEFDECGRGHAIKSARRALDTALQRSYRAKQVSKGIKVNKAT